MSPEEKEYCPNNWFELKKDVHQDGYCKQLSWKCCFICVCLPLCYPCYLTRTVRFEFKKNMLWTKGNEFNRLQKVTNLYTIMEVIP